MLSVRIKTRGISKLSEGVNPSPAAMEGQGGYNRNSQVQAGGVSPAIPMLERAAQAGSLPADPQPILIADYGCSEGRNSLAPMRAAIKILRDRVGPGRSIAVVHTDLPVNDFTVLFETLLSSPESYLRNDSAVYASAVGRSFYGQILPAKSVTVGWSSWAVQWLSRTPGIIPDHVHVSLTSDAAVRAIFLEQSRQDWENFLIARGRELRPGGALAVVTMALDDHGEFGYRPLSEAMYQTLVEMVNDGFISAQELRGMCIPTVGRSRADFLAPFAEGTFHGLRVEEAEVFYSPDPFWSDYQQNGNAQEFGGRWAGFSRASVFPTFARCLVDRNSPHTTEFVARLEAGMVARLAAEPEPMVIPLGRILLAKEG
jgi:SAM dependent carboxyl methyltransferase